MRKRLNHLLLASIGLLMAVAIAAASPAKPAWSAEDGADVSAERTVAAPAEAPAVEEGKAAEENVGFPQLNTKTYPSQLFWLFVSFTLLYVLMSKLALPRVGEVLELRREQRESNLKRAEELQAEAAKAKSAYESALAKAQESAAEAMSAAEQEISEKLAAESAKFTEHSRKRIATAEQAIAKAKSDALASLADISADISVEIVGKVAAVQVTKADAKKVVTDVMKKEAA